MKKLRTAGFGLLLFAVVFVLSTCGKHRAPARTLGPSLPGSSVEDRNASALLRYVFTQEDRMLMAMPYEKRLAYLHRRLKDLVFDIHGIVIEESASTNRTVSAVDEDWPHHRIRTGSDKEELALDNQYREEHRWPLTFLERMRGDLNFDGVVSISDITPIAVNFGAHYEDDPLNPHWVPVENVAAPHVDRVSDGNESIGIEDTTAIAVDFGMQIRGYSVCSFPKSGTLEDSQLIAQWLRAICRCSGVILRGR